MNKRHGRDRWTLADIRKLSPAAQSAIGCALARSTTNVERNTRNESVGKKTHPRFNTPVCIHIHSIRKRLADSDGISGKAAIDGLVRGGILENDTAKKVKQVTYSQETGDTEETYITITKRGANMSAGETERGKLKMQQLLDEIDALKVAHQQEKAALLNEIKRLKKELGRQ